MSESMQEHAADAKQYAAGLAAVAKRFPGARMEVLWDDGPCVPIVDCAEGRTLANKIQAAIVGGEMMLIPYAEIGPIRVYWGRWEPGTHVSLVLEALAKDAPAMYARLVEEVKR